MTAPTTLNTVAQLINEIRINTKLPNASQISDSTILTYINTFFIQDVPQEIQLLSYKTTYTFTTQANVDRYIFPANTYTTIFGPVFCAGVALTTYQDPDLFQIAWVLNNQYPTVANGNGTSGPYSFTVPFPAVRGFIDILGNLNPGVYINTDSSSGGNQQIVDNGSGVLLSGVTAPLSSGLPCGNIDYITGQCTVSFPSPTTNPIYANVQTYSAGMPGACLFYNNAFTLRNVPDQGYTISVAAYVNPAGFASLPGGYSSPVIINNMFKYIAYGVARWILLEYKDLSQLEIINGLYREQEAMLRRISTTQRFVPRIKTIFNTGFVGPVWQTNIPYNQ